MSTGRCCCLCGEEERYNHQTSAFQERVFCLFSPILCIFFDFSKVLLICIGMDPSFLEIFAKNPSFFFLGMAGEIINNI